MPLEMTEDLVDSNEDLVDLLNVGYPLMLDCLDEDLFVAVAEAM